MPKAKFHLVQDNGDSQITLHYENRPLVADASHPRWDDIYRLVVIEDNPDEAADLFDVTRLLRRSILSERVTVTYNAVLFDNDPVHDALADHIIRLVNEGEDVSAWVALLENIKQNPNPESVEQLFRHLSAHEYTITPKGMIIAYKGVRSYDDLDTYWSTRSGPYIVNGVEGTGYVPQKVGDTVEMPRSAVQFDPSIACSTGLHVADWNYARGMGGTVLAVLVHPRDVVSVPNDHKDAKVRVCRYKVLEVRTAPYSGAVLKTDVTVSISPSPQETLPLEEAVDEGTTFKIGDHVYFRDDVVFGDPIVGIITNVDTDWDSYTVNWGDYEAPGYASDELQLVDDTVTSNSKDDESSETTTQEKPVSTTDAPVRYRYPSPAKFDELVNAAKRQKKGVRRFIEAKTEWSLIPGRGEGADRKDWSVKPL